MSASGNGTLHSALVGDDHPSAIVASISRASKRKTLPGSPVLRYFADVRCPTIVGAHRNDRF